MIYVLISIVLVTILLGYLYSRHKRKVVAEVRAALVERVTPVVVATSVVAKPSRTRPMPTELRIARCQVCGRRLTRDSQFCSVHAGKR